MLSQCSHNFLPMLSHMHNSRVSCPKAIWIFSSFYMPASADILQWNDDAVRTFAVGYRLHLMHCFNASDSLFATTLFLSTFNINFIADSAASSSPLYLLHGASIQYHDYQAANTRRSIPSDFILSISIVGRAIDTLA